MKGAIVRMVTGSIGKSASCRGAAVLQSADATGNRRGGNHDCTDERGQRRRAGPVTRPTFYMVEMDYPCETELDRVAYDAFYDRHIAMLLSIPGFLSAQRFECTHAARAPFLAIYRVAEPAVMTSEAYTSTAGRLSVPEDFRKRMINWDRNLVQAVVDDVADPDAGIDVAATETLTLIDRLTDDAPALPDDFTPLEVVGLDRTIAERGVRIGDSGAPVAGREGWIVRSFRPLQPIRGA